VNASQSGTVHVVAVSFFGSSDVQGLLASLQAGGGDWRLVVVDNACDAGERGRLQATLAGEPRARVVTAATNLGYLGGARLGLEGVDAAATPWTVVANTDLRFAPTFVEELSRRTDEAVVAPAIVSEASGADQNPYLVKRPSRLTVLRWRLEFATLPVARLVVALGQLSSVVRRAAGPRASARDARQVYAPHGSCVALPSSFFARGGTLEHGSFLFGEEITLAERARTIGMPVVHVPDLVVHHAEHRATGWWRSRQMLEWQRASVREIARLLNTRAS